MPKTKSTVAEKSVARASRAADARDASEDLSSIDSLELWARYAEQPDPKQRDKDVRNELVSRYVHIVRYLAERIHARLPNEVDVEDLVTAGCFGLMEAADNFDLARGVKFETFCTQRIRGSIFDELRAMDWVPRLVRSRTNKVEAAKKSFESRTGRAPTDDEIAGELGVDDSEYQKILRDSRPVSMVSLDRKAFDGDSNKDVREIDVIRDTRQTDPRDAVQGVELKNKLRKGLSVTEKLILNLYYFEELTMKDIGRTLALSESRVSQLHSSILARLKSQLQHRQERDEEE
ncbi:MAG: FliA/WhiG family RNA polymerase sigma factor [Phycisphaerales bacterium]|nr:FliA/WhiG family RNA polymerase sigma factor [Phycisphaerales bacterium]